MRGVLLGRVHHRLHQVSGHLQGIASQGHGRGSGVGLHACDGAVKPTDTQGTGDHPDGHARVFQYRALFDVGLKVRPDGVLSRHFTADIANSLQFLEHGFALLVLRLVGMRQRKRTGKHT